MGLSVKQWASVVAVAALTMLLTFLAITQVQHWRADEAVLHEIVGLIQAGRIHVEPPAVPPAPLLPVPAAPKKP